MMGAMGRTDVERSLPRADVQGAGPVGRPVRALLALVLGVVMISAALWGANDDWPFTPMLQFALPSKASGIVWVTHAYGTFDDGEDKVLDAAQIGLRAAELDGQGRYIASHPGLLRELGTYYRQRHLQGPQLVAIRIQRDAMRLRPDHSAVPLRRRRLLGEVQL